MSNRSPELAGSALVLAAATLWGTLGVAYRLMLGSAPISPIGLATLRAGLGFVILLVALALLRPRLLRVPCSELPYLVLFGLVSVALFYAVYAEAVALTTVATAVVLLYTAPAWVALLAWRIYGEPLGARTLAALLLTFCGSALVAGATTPSTLAGSAPGIAAGLASGLTYGLYSIFGRRALTQHDPWTILVYVLGFGAAFLAAFQVARSEPLVPALSPAAWLGLIFIAVGPTLGALFAYTEGLRRLPTSVASLLSTWEPAVGAILGFAVLGETLSAAQLVGASLIVAGVVAIRLPNRQA